jgi:hypothetical protein
MQNQSYKRISVELEGNYMQAKEDYLNCLLRSYGSQDSQMGRLSCVSSGQKQLKRGHQARVHSDQMVLVMARQGGWAAMRRWPKTLKTKLNLKGDF